MTTAPSAAPTTQTVMVKGMEEVFYLESDSFLKQSQLKVSPMLGSDVEQSNIFVMGGYSAGITGAVEVISLDDSLDCGPQTPLPFVSEEMLAVVDSEGRPLACGGTGQTSTDCVVYDEGTWVSGPSMNFARNFGPDSVLLSDGRWFVTGDDNSPG